MTAHKKPKRRPAAPASTRRRKRITALKPASTTAISRRRSSFEPIATLTDSYQENYPSTDYQRKYET